MNDKKLITGGRQCIQEFEHLTQEGASRRNLLKTLGIAGVAMASASTILGSANVLASPSATEVKGKKGGRIKVASLSSSTSDTLDPAKGALSTDYTRHYMVYNGLTRFDEHLVPHLELAESIDNQGRHHLDNPAQKRGDLPQW
ncbi:twin-arginine translocation signal domain-containing protein [Vibrio sp. PP-XX7]